MEYINNERTKAEFGYDVESLKKGSSKKVYRICCDCGVEDLRPARNILTMNQIVCHRCINNKTTNSGKQTKGDKIKNHWANNPHPLLGKHHSEETLEKMRNKTVSTEVRERITIGGKKFRESAEYLSRPKRRLSKEHIELIRERSKRNVKRGKESNFYGKNFFPKWIYYTRASGEVIKLKSTWEEATAKFLERNNIEWDYEVTTFPVNYIYNGENKEGTYTPDFFLKNGEVWEVKGHWREIALLKFEAFKKTYPEINIIVMDQQKLRDLDII